MLSCRKTVVQDYPVLPVKPPGIENSKQCPDLALKTTNQIKPQEQLNVQSIKCGDILKELADFSETRKKPTNKDQWHTPLEIQKHYYLL